MSEFVELEIPVSCASCSAIGSDWVEFEIHNRTYEYKVGPQEFRCMECDEITKFVATLGLLVDSENIKESKKKRAKL